MNRKKEVGYDEWEVVIDSVSSELKKYGKAYKHDAMGDYLLIQEWNGYPSIDLIVTGSFFTKEILNNLVDLLGSFEVFWRIKISYYSHDFQLNEYEYIAIDANGWHPIDANGQRIK